MEKESLGKYIAGIYRYSQCIINKKFEGYDIGSGQQDFLYVICNHQGISQTELSKMLHIGKGTTTKAIKHLEKAGYVRREKDLEDKRAYKLYLTEKGNEIAPLVNEAYKEMRELYGEGFSVEEYIYVLNALKKILKNLHDAKGCIECNE